MTLGHYLFPMWTGCHLVRLKVLTVTMHTWNMLLFLHTIRDPAYALLLYPPYPAYALLFYPPYPAYAECDEEYQEDNVPAATILPRAIKVGVHLRRHQGPPIDLERKKSLHMITIECSYIHFVPELQEPLLISLSPSSATRVPSAIKQQFNEHVTMASGYRRGRAPSTRAPSASWRGVWSHVLINKGMNFSRPRPDRPELSYV